ncbi:ABC transporter CDR4 [Verticillium alfalfae VaMs.102]|uniref:ABC transporter CDR4 n=1 Tax=Verticillium alfalfae (strain VaMs.102 / ATCC MYA-4576 / FGSC 10136) TaxID=526221 RepID=C9SUA4_VERA1|nr:ABC transporter CDR4 [Verticillium alfalfae VaMs.102]EEY22415.1 ABC transporter CDR4 [Verticillium alfalfae VaMs.102]
MFILTGYVIPRSTLMSDSPWFGWFSYVNPVAYGYEALLGNEFGGRELRCSESNLVPRGPGADADYQGCTLPGVDLWHSRSKFGGRQTLASWLAFTVFFLLVNVWAVEKGPLSPASGAHSLVFAKPSESKEETSAEQQKADETLDKIGDGTSVFTFKDIRYTVPYGTGHRRLLNGVNGYAAPGKMVALMGSSGAGKTTLLNTLAQRQRIGVVSSDILVNGVVPGAAFKRGTGFCEQRDIHEGSSTVREALDFSALLRQEKHIPKAEKLAYVDRIVRLLELDSLSHALISSLTVEQRKRVTIGVELAARPSLLLFLDEPTSGLDSQSAFSIVRFLRRLADAGQAIICTIHQPSSDLIEQFDMILALNRGGNTFYFGPVGENGGSCQRRIAA